MPSFVAMMQFTRSTRRNIVLKVVCPGWGWIRHHAEPRETMGDLLGRHGVLCGDSGDPGS